ncbi:hypothetical protein Smp_123140 [Schistosoma mansoni]|uniref:hypothetical protein n=1 Tax=Schistosoma mansoni TaxID=6183 RepID=UPI00022DC451|nr:hypothetical protein Smp_123140 [Schistosoma mansoni]|eukprot:XP_018652928.1 hypothetical protein Smp_123140 [Schistosoma mansoni]
MLLTSPTLISTSSSSSSSSSTSPTCLTVSSIHEIYQSRSFMINDILDRSNQTTYNSIVNNNHEKDKGYKLYNEQEDIQMNYDLNGYIKHRMIPYHKKIFINHMKYQLDQHDEHSVDDTRQLIEGKLKEHYSVKVRTDITFME